MSTTTVRKPSTKANLDMAKEIASLQDQVKANSEAIKQALPRDKVDITTNVILSIIGIVFVVMMGFNGIMFNYLKNDINDVKQDIKSTNQRIDKLDTKIDSNYKELSSKIDTNHKQILDILLKRK